MGHRLLRARANEYSFRRVKIEYITYMEMVNRQLDNEGQSLEKMGLLAIISKNIPISKPTWQAYRFLHLT